MTINRIAASGENGIITDMARTHTTFRTWAALILLGALIVAFASLGNWQLNRAAQRDADHDQITLAARLPPVTLTADTPRKDMTAWRHADARGRWMHRYTVLLENRNHHAQPGYWVATPLQLVDIKKDGQHDPYALLVLRGWLARDDVIQGVDDGSLPRVDPSLALQLAQSDTIHTVTGQLFPHIPRLFELWSWSESNNSRLPDPLIDTRQNLPALQNLDLNEYAQATGLELLPIVLAQTSPELQMVQDWPLPSAGADTNRGYALQWFLFCAIAAGAWLWIAGQTLWRSKRGVK